MNVRWEIERLKCGIVILNLYASVMIMEKVACIYTLCHITVLIVIQLIEKKQSNSCLYTSGTFEIRFSLKKKNVGFATSEHRPTQCARRHTKIQSNNEYKDTQGYSKTSSRL